MIKSWIPYTIRFVVGGGTVAAVSMIAKLSPHISGLMSAFPAVFLTALVLIRFSAGHRQSLDFAKGGIHGVIGTLLTAVATLAGLVAHFPWYIAISGGLAAYIAYGAYIATRKSAS